MARKRLPIDTFEFPLAELRYGCYSAVYFNRTKRILEKNTDEFHTMDGTMQVFQKNFGILCGIDEVIALLAQCTGHWTDQNEADQVFEDYMASKSDLCKNPLNQDAAMSIVHLERLLGEMWIDTFDQLTVEALYDGDWISPWEPVLRITGNYSHFAHLESVYLGILARGSKVASNTQNVVEAASGKQVLFFADRFDRWSNQKADGYAAYVGGASGVATNAMGSWRGVEGIGTMPHSLIAMCKGDVAEAALQFNDIYPEVNTVALVDFNNNCVADTKACLDVLGDKLWGVRLDTSENVVDPAVLRHKDYGSCKPTGVNRLLVEKVRTAMDSYGYPECKIIVSGGFNPEKIEMFEQLDVPVDAYAVGSSLLAGSNDFTADLVSPACKVGRKEQPHDRLSMVTR